MNSGFLRILAVLMMVAALVTVYLGYRSDQTPEKKVEVVIPTYTQVVARNEIPVGHVLTAEDLEITTTQQQDAQTFSDLQSLLGKVPVVAVHQGEAFRVSHFPVTSLLGQALAPHERAVAIKVNEVVGVGGFITPGDYVDVLLYLRPDRETGDVSSAQTVLTKVKVLAYGALIGEVDAGKHDIPSTPGAMTIDAANTSRTVNTPDSTSTFGSGSTTGSTKSGSENNQPGSKSARDSRSAILAVPEQDVAKLMLADSTGILRLALRDGIPDIVPEAAAVAAPDTGVSAIADNHFIRLGDISRPSSETLPKQHKSTAPAKVSVKKHAGTAVAKRERVIVYHGDKMEVVNVAK